MGQRRLRCGGRKKAPFGSQEAAILAAAGINVAGTLAASAISASATKKAAQDQANATIRSATKQAQAVKDQTNKSKEYQREAQEFVKEQNAENRELQKDIQLQLQMLTGQQNVNDRLEASKIKVKAGGKTNRLGFPQSLLRGGNMPFQVSDGGGVFPVGVTPEGFELYEIFGNDHEHYHKTRGGKYKNPRVFTEQGVAMLATVLKSKKAIQTSIAIMKTFVNMRHYIKLNESVLPNRNSFIRRKSRF